MNIPLPRTAVSRPSQPECAGTAHGLPARRPIGRLLPLLLSAALLIGAAAAHAQKPEARASLALRHTAPALPDAQLLGPTSGLKPLALTLVLPLRNRSMLDARIKRISDFKDALYGRYLTPEEFAQQFGPDQSDVDAVAAFAQKHGLTVQDVSPDLTLVHVAGPAASVEAAFGVHINDYVGADGRQFYAADGEPTATPAVASRLLSILGLSNAQTGRAFSHSTPDVPLLGAANGFVGLTPKDVQNIYGLTGAAYTGSGQVAGLYEMGTFTQSDVNTYFSTYGVPATLHVNPVSIDGYSTTSAPSYDASEVTLDVDMLAALAPGLSQIRIYESSDQGAVGFTQSIVDTFTAMSNETAANRPSVISMSYGESEDFVAASEYQALDQATAHLAAQGQTVCISSGDSGAYTDENTGSQPSASFPADDPYVLCVGGTDLNDAYDAGHNCVYVSETSWSDTADKGHGPFGTGGGGGYSAFFPFPTYQSGSFTAAGNPQGSLSKRNVPDVSLYGDFDTGGYDVYFTSPTKGPGWHGYNGTSASSPLWAAFLADVNQARAAKSLAAVGFANPAIYQQAEASAYSTLFHDIADGSNNLFYNAVKGYDNSTGWGSFQGSRLLTALSASAATVVPTSLALTPNPVVGGQNVTGTVTLSAGAPAGGALVSVSVNGSAVSSFTIAATKTSGAFTLTTAAVSATTTKTVGASYNGTTVTKVLTISPASAAPTITSFTPASGPVGTSVTITGTNFTGVTAVKFGTTAATFTLSGATKITGKVAAGTTTGKITVTTPGGAATSSATYTVTALLKPTVTSFTPITGPVGTSVTINGTNFISVSAVKFGTTAATFTLSGTTKITAKVAAGTSTGKITVTTPGGAATSAASFTVTVSAAPTITSFTPASGPVGTSVTINGTNFTGATAVKFGGTAATFTLSGTSKITAKVAAGTSTGKVSVTTPKGMATSSGTYTVTSSTATLSAFSYNPNPGYSGGLSQGAVSLSGPAPAGGASVAITNNGNTLATIVIPAGQTTGSYEQTLPGVSTSTAYPIAATYAGTTLNLSLVVNPSPVTLSGFSLTPNPVASGGTITFTVTLSGAAPAGGVPVGIYQAGTYLGYLTIPAGSSSVTFTLTAPTETSPTTVGYAAEYNGTSLTVNEMVN